MYHQPIMYHQLTDTVPPTDNVSQLTYSVVSFSAKYIFLLSRKRIWPFFLSTSLELVKEYPKIEKIFFLPRQKNQDFNIFFYSFSSGFIDFDFLFLDRFYRCILWKPCQHPNLYWSWTLYGNCKE